MAKLRKVSPSAYEKWKKCPAYTRLIEFAPRTQSIYAKEGTEDHETAQIVLDSNEELDLDIFTTSKKRQSCITEYVNYVREIEKEAKCKCKCELTFQFVFCGQLIKGTVDCVVLDKENDILHVIDLKTGAGNSIDAYENGQLILYAIGLSILLKKRNIIVNNYRLTIVQPNDFKTKKIRHWDITREELLEKFHELQDIIKYNALHQSEYWPGSHCNLCNCITICPILQSELKTIDTRKEVSQLTIEDKADILEMKPRIEKFLKEIETSVLNDINGGKINPNDVGMKWVKGNNYREIVNQKALLKRLIEMGFEDELMTIPKLGWLEKNLGKDELADWTVTKERNPRLVSLEAKGEEIKPLKEMLDKF